MTSAGIVIASLVERGYAASVTRMLTASAHIAGDIYEHNAINNASPEELTRVCTELSGKIGATVEFITPDGQIVGQTLKRAPKSLANEAVAARMASSGCRLCHPEARNTKGFSVSRAVFVDNTHIGDARVTVPGFGVRRASVRTQRITFVALIVATVLAVALSQRLAAAVTKPAARLSDVARSMAQGDLSQRVDSSHAGELAELADSFNTMAGQMEQALNRIAEDKNRMETILTTMADGVIVADEDGKITLFNNASERLLGMVGRNVTGLLIEKSGLPEDLIRMALDSLQSADIIRKELHISPDDNEMCLGVHSLPIRSQSSAVAGVAVVLHDQTAMWQREKNQREFVSNVSHEFRTPVTAVRVTAEALLSGAKNDPVLLDSFLASLVQESDRLSLLIDDLLALAKNESGNRTLRKINENVRELLTRVVDLHYAKAENEGVTLTIAVTDDVFAYVDEQQMEQVLSNLIDNAIKCTPEGGQVTVCAEDKCDSTVLSVIDTGIGIASADVSRLFERFYRSDKARSRKKGGSGLGLSIVRSIVDAHGGHITVQSTPGVGSTFTVVIPKSEN